MTSTRRSASLLVCCMLVFSLAVPSSAEDCTESQIQGKVDAARLHSGASWFLGGVGSSILLGVVSSTPASGLLLGFIGTGISTGAAAMTNPQPARVPTTTGQNSVCYVDGYMTKAKRENMLSALGGGLVGTAVIMVLWGISD